MKKFFSLLLAVLLVASLAACGGGSGSEGGSNAPADSGTSAPADTGSGSKAEAVDTNTVAVGAVVIARDDVSEDDVYKFVSTIFENTGAITEQHAKGDRKSVV